MSMAHTDPEDDLTDDVRRMTVRPFPGLSTATEDAKLAADREYLQCPKCGSKMVETTCVGHLGPRTNDPNKATCQDCKRTGKAGDWWLIQELRAQLAKAVTAYFARPFIEAPPLHKSMEDYEREMREKLDQFRPGRM